MFRIYLTNLGKYNEGELVGEWVDLPISEEELDEVYKRIGINFDEPIDGTWYEETFITDYENDVDYAVGEYDSISELNEIAEKVESLSDYDKKVLESAIELGYVDDITDFDADDYWLAQNVNTDEDLGYYYVEDVYGGLDQLDQSTKDNYIEYAEIGREIRRWFSSDIESYLNIDMSDEDEVQEVCEQFGVDDIDDITAEDFFGQFDTINSDWDLGYSAVANDYYPPSENDFDYEGFGRDIRIGADGGFTSNGWLERS